MLYLAQVQQSSGLINRKTELKLLAELKPGLVWSEMAPEVIPAPEASQFSSGVLVLAELQDQHRIVKVKDATSLLVKSLQKTSLLQEKLSVQRAELNEWKHSLIYQAQVLNHRTVEFEQRLQELRQMEAGDRLDQLKHLGDEYEDLQMQRSEINGASQKMQNLSQHLEAAYPLYQALETDIEFGQSDQS